MKQTKTSITLETASAALKCSLKQWEYLPILLKISSWLPVSANMFDICPVLTLCASGGQCSSIASNLCCPSNTFSSSPPSSFPCQQHFQPSSLQQLTLWDRMVPLWGSTQCPCKGLVRWLEAIADQANQWPFSFCCHYCWSWYLCLNPSICHQWSSHLHWSSRAHQPVSLNLLSDFSSNRRNLSG